MGRIFNRQMEIAVLNRPTMHERLLWSKRFRVSTVPLWPQADS